MACGKLCSKHYLQNLVILLFLHSIGFNKIVQHIQNLFSRDVISNCARIRQNTSESVLEFIDESVLNYIPPKDVKRFLNWHSQGLKQANKLLKRNGRLDTFT